MSTVHRHPPVPLNIVTESQTFPVSTLDGCDFGSWVPVDRDIDGKKCYVTKKRENAERSKNGYEWVFTLVVGQKDLLPLGVE